jgi:hypothetical protein
MTRKEMIDKLVQHDVEFDDNLILDLLYNGFKGYNNMTDEELKELYEQQGL